MPQQTKAEKEVWSAFMNSPPNDAMIERAVDVHVRISQAITRRN